MRASVFLSCWLLAGVAAADAGEAERLFAEAQKLRADGRFALACDKLEESLEADWALGALLYLADCYERTGRLASAYEKFRQGQIDAITAGDTRRAELAKKAMQALEPRLAKLELVADEIGAEIALDGWRVPRASWDGVAVDPGEHVVTLSLPGGRPIVRRVQAPAEGQTARIEFELPAPPRPRSRARALPREPEPTPELDDTDIAAIAFGAVAVIGTAVGTGLLVHARSTYNASAEHCTLDDVCEDEGLAARSEARQLATGATVAYAGAGAAAAAAIVLVVVGVTDSDSDSQSTVGVAPGPPGAFGAAVRARW